MRVGWRARSGVRAPAGTRWVPSPPHQPGERPCPRPGRTWPWIGTWRPPWTLRGLGAFGAALIHFLALRKSRYTKKHHFAEEKQGLLIRRSYVDQYLRPSSGAACPQL